MCGGAFQGFPGQWVSKPRSADDGGGFRCGILAFLHMGNETTSEATLTPVMRQYFAAKEQNPDCVVVYTFGDFYELFYEDAILVSRELQLTLTARDREKK